MNKSCKFKVHLLFLCLIGIFHIHCSENTTPEPPSEELIGTWQISTEVIESSISQTDENSICDTSGIDSGSNNYDFDNFELIVNEDTTVCSSGTIHSGTTVSSGNTAFVDFTCEASGDHVDVTITYIQLIENCEYNFTNSLQIDLAADQTLVGDFSANLEISEDCENNTVLTAGICPFSGTVSGSKIDE